MKPDDFLKGGRILVSKHNFAVVKARREIEGAFAILRDMNEITVVIEQKRVKKEDAISIERD